MRTIFTHPSPYIHTLTVLWKKVLIDLNGETHHKQVQSEKQMGQ
jgi:hypothetical protein